MSRSLVTYAVVLAASAASAQTPNAAADAAYQEGRRLYDLQEWDQAIAKFKEAYKLRADAPALFNIAQSYRLKGDCASAASFYKTFKRNYPKERNVDKFIAEMDACAKTGTKPAGGADPQPATTPPGPTNTGSANTVTTTPATTSKLPAEPIKTAPVTATPMTTAPARTEPATSTGTTSLTTSATSSTSAGDAGGRTKRIAGLAIAGTGVVLVGTGVVFAFKARGLANQAESFQQGTVWDPSIQTRGVRAEHVSWITLGLGAAAIAGGGVLYVKGRRATSSTEHAAVGLVPETGGASLVWSGGF